MDTHRFSCLCYALCASLTLLASPAFGQVKFSIDWNGPTVGAIDCATGIAITEGDILGPCSGVPVPAPPLIPPPRILLTAGDLEIGSYLNCVGHPGGTPCSVEVDALSFGGDALLIESDGLQAGQLWFSVDEYAGGAPIHPAQPAVWSEYLRGEASADAFINLSWLPPAPLQPWAVLPEHVGAIDGNGFSTSPGFFPAYPGLGLIEPNVPSYLPVAAGDNLDALDRGPIFDGGAFYSLDSAFLDPCTGIPGTASAQTHGVVGGDVLQPAPGGLPQVWAPATSLGLDLVAGPDSDDLDALVLWENGDGVFIASERLYQWQNDDEGVDMLLFSVRRGSAVIGMPDSLTGTPIEPGDILAPPIPAVQGGLSPYPALFIAAENLGLGTLRSGTATGACDNGDELDALDITEVFPPLHDCDGNGIEDAIDIANGTHPDLNKNGVPDSCQAGLLLDSPYCFCSTNAPCGNTDPQAGCLNSAGAGALLSAGGSSSILQDDLTLITTGIPSFKFGLTFRANIAVGPFSFGDGQLCIGQQISRFSVMNSGSTGTFSYGPGLIQAGVISFIPGQTDFTFQTWYRDPSGPCGSGFNLSNAVAITFY